MLDTPDEGTERMGLKLKHAVMAYQQIYHQNRSELDAAWRTLFRLIRWIDGSSLNLVDKWHYVSMVRAQLAWVEQVMLFYNALTKEGAKFSLLANKYALFDNLNEGDELIRFACLKLTGPQDGRMLWPYVPEAFDSGLAKSRLGIPLDT
jgi:hypothetical protein